MRPSPGVPYLIRSTALVTTIANSAANFAPSGSNAGAVPDHSILGPFVCFSNSIRALVYLIKARFLCIWFACTFNSSNSLAGAHQSAAQVRPLPLVIDAVELTILYTAILGHGGDLMLLRLSPAFVRPARQRVHRAPDAQRHQHPSYGAARHRDGGPKRLETEQNAATLVQ